MASVYKTRFENGVLIPEGEVDLTEGEYVVYAKYAETWRPGMQWDEILRLLYAEREIGSRAMDDYPKFD